MNFLKCLNGLCAGTIIPEDMRQAVTDGGVADWTNELRRTLIRDGVSFLCHIEKSGVIVEHLHLRGPIHKELAPQFKEDGKTEPLTATRAQVGARVEFMNFKPVFQTRTIGVIVDWGSVLIWILSHYKWADMKILMEGSDFLEQRHIGTHAARATVRNLAYVAYFRATGLWMDNDKPPRGTNLTWVEGELKAQDKLLGKDGN